MVGAQDHAGEVDRQVEQTPFEKQAPAQGARTRLSIAASLASRAVWLLARRGNGLPTCKVLVANVCSAVQYAFNDF
jgi:hypothetical protein